jgi:hypothetical protein
MTCNAIPLPDPTPALPPFSGDDAVCIQCSHPEAITTYRPACGHLMEEYNGKLRRLTNAPARLERRCERCDFQWDEALNPPVQQLDAASVGPVPVVPLTELQKPPAGPTAYASGAES